MSGARDTVPHMGRHGEPAGGMTPSIVPVPPVAEEFARELPRDAEGHHVALRSIGIGGMGEVVEVDDRALRRRAAKKLLHPDLQASVRSQRMFLREARITGQLEHPNIVPVHELGLDPAGRLYFTMKRVEGQTLRDYVLALPDGPFDHKTLLNLVDVVIRVCDALAYAHSRGVVHCDLKASNVMVGDFGQVYLVDWGVARLARDEKSAEHVEDGLAPTATEDQPSIAGTPTSMASEQARGEHHRIGPRTDVFAVGALLYEVIVGEPPYSATHVMAALYKAAVGDYPPLVASDRGRAIPPELVRIVTHAMSLDPAARYPDVASLREALVHFVRGRGEFPTTAFPAGTAIITEGEAGHSAYRIVSGTCSVYITRGGQTSFIRRMGEGEVFGEMAILSPGPRTATVIADTDVFAEVITAEVLEWELETVRPWLATIIRSLAARFRERGL